MNNEKVSNCPYISVEELIERIRRYHPDDDMDLVRRAYAFSEQAHHEQRRKSGDPYLNQMLNMQIERRKNNPEAKFVNAFGMPPFKNDRRESPRMCVCPFIAPPFPACFSFAIFTLLR